MSRQITLYHKALLAWRGELAKLKQGALEDKKTKLRDALYQRLREMVGPEYVIDLEDEDDPDDLVLEAMVDDDLNFLSFRNSEGEIKIILVMPCPNCRYRMVSDPITGLADVGRELLQLEMIGRLGNHQC